MSTIVVVGAQWGDEGKGKVVDLLASEADVVVRFHGGNNAGHTLMVGSQLTVLHLVPSGVLHPGKVCVIAGGTVVDPEVLIEEIESLRKRGFLSDPSCLKISEQAHLIMPYHKAIDLAREKRRGSGKIGTTGRGIGPAYEDKVARAGIRFVDLIDETLFRAKLERNLREKNLYLRYVLGEQEISGEEILSRYLRFRDLLGQYVTDTALYLHRAIGEGKRVLFEGAQGMMLDVDHGTYPFVTSSNTVAGGVCAGAGISPRMVDEVIGICKAYTTRVGSGPFPTELESEIGKRLREEGREFGSTTGRPRRCGWFDAVVVRQAARLNGLTGLAITKLDVLSGIDPIRVCRAYRYNGAELAHVPASERVMAAVEPVFEDLPGWKEPLGDLRRLEELPAAARRYIRRLEELTGARVCMISVGAGREQTIRL